jgi:hypothetical protein
VCFHQTAHHTSGICSPVVTTLTQTFRGTLTLTATSGPSKTGIQWIEHQRSTSWKEILEHVSYARLIKDITKAVNPAATAGESGDSTHHIESMHFVASETAPVKRGSIAMNPVTSDTVHGLIQNLYCPLIALAEVNPADFFTANSQIVPTLMKAIADERTSTEYLFSIAVINMFDMLSAASQLTSGLGSSIITDRQVVLNCFESFFKSIQGQCRDGMLSVILSMDLESECLWNESLTTPRARVSYIQMIISTLTECLIDTQHCLQHVKMIACKAPASSKATLFSQGSFSVPVLMFSTKPNTPEADFFNQSVSVQKYPIQPLPTTFEKLDFIPTVFTPLLQPYVIEKSTGHEAETIYAPAITPVLDF